MRKPLLRSCFGTAELWVSSAPPLLPIIALPATTSPSSLMPRQDCYFTKKTVAIRQLPHFLLSDWQIHLYPHPVSVEQAWFLLEAVEGSLLPLWAPHCIGWPHIFPGSFPSVYRWAQAPYLLWGCWYLMVFLPEILLPTWPPFPGQGFGLERLFLSLRLKIPRCSLSEHLTFLWPIPHCWASFSRPRALEGKTMSVLFPTASPRPM